MIRVSLLRSKEQLFPGQCINKAAEILQQVVEETLNKDDLSSQDKESSIVGMKSLLLIQDVLDQNTHSSVSCDVYDTRDVHQVLTTPQTVQGRPRMRSLLTQFRQVKTTSKALAKQTRKLMQVNASLQNQNLCTDLRWVAKQICKSAP